MGEEFSRVGREAGGERPWGLELSENTQPVLDMHNSAVIVVLYEFDANEEQAGDERSSILAPVF